jgi:hypothetical protein
MMTWAGHVTRMGRRGIHIGYLWKIQKERDHCEKQDIGGRITLIWMLKRQDWMA